MIYFLVNNSYHLDLDLRLAKELVNNRLGLIQVPLALRPLAEHSLFNRVLCLENVNFASFKNFLLHPLAKVQIEKRLNTLLEIDQNDILLVHSEIPSMNQWLIQKFFDGGAKVFLLEDGPATIVDNNLPVFERSLRNKIRTIFLRHVRGLKYSSILNIGDQSLPRMEDFIFNGVIVNYGGRINRDLKLYQLSQVKETFNIDFDKGAMFLSQPLYLWYLSDDEYINYIGKILDISEAFSPFYFKFHPSDTEKVKKSIESIIKQKYPDIVVIKEQLIAEKLITKYPVKHAISFTSTVLVNLINKNVTPIFLNKLFFEEYPSVESSSFSDFLVSFDCYSPQERSEIRPGFTAFGSQEKPRRTYSISEILKL